MPHVAIMLPGIMGSVLKLDSEVIWPGPITSLFLPYKKMKELMSDNLVATDCIRHYAVTNQYQTLIDDLNTCGFDEQNGTLVVCAYDWRKDNAVSAETLARHVEDASSRHGPDVEVSLVAHSMGGLVARHYLESGKFNTRPGFGRVRRLITLGTPHNGAAIALSVVLGHEKRLFLSKEQVFQASSDPRFPSAYQLLPPQGEPFAWNKAVGTELGLLDIYENDVATRLGLISQNLDAAARFHRSLDVGRRPIQVRYFCFSGTQQTTATHVHIRQGGALATPDKIEEDGGGDGTVPTWSSFLPGIQRMFVGGEHSNIYRTPNLRRTLATILGKEGYLLGVPDEVQVAIRDKVVEPKDLVHVTIGFTAEIRDFSGVLTLERAKIDESTGHVTSYDPPAVVNRVTYSGLDVESIALVFDAPNIRGIYRVSFRDELEKPPSGYDELIVQEPLKH